MARFKLSREDDWQLVHDQQDIRGWPVKNGEGRRVGTVEALIADTESELVETLVLDDGRELPAEGVTLDDGVVLAPTLPTAGVVVAEVETADPHTPDPVLVGVFDTHRPDFVNHCRTTYGTDETGFPTYEPAYRFGFESGTHDDFRDRDFDGAESLLRSRFEDRHGEGTFQTMRHAVKYGYDRGRGL